MILRLPRPPVLYTWSYITWPSYGWHQGGLRSRRLEVVCGKERGALLPSAWYYYIQLGAKTQSKIFVKLKPSRSPDKNRVPVSDRLGPGRSWLLLTWDKASWRGKMANNKRSAKYRKKTGEREWSGLLNPLHGSPPPSRSPHYSPFSPNIACEQAPLFGRAKQYILRVTQREYSSKPLKHNIVERILVFKR